MIKVDRDHVLMKGTEDSLLTEFMLLTCKLSELLMSSERINCPIDAQNLFIQGFNMACKDAERKLFGEPFPDEDDIDSKEDD